MTVTSFSGPNPGTKKDTRHNDTRHSVTITEKDCTNTIFEFISVLNSNINLGKKCAPPSNVVACLILSMESKAAVVSGDTGETAEAMDFMLRSTTRGAWLLLGVVVTIAAAAAFSAFFDTLTTLSE